MTAVKIDWNEERVERLKALYAKGMSFNDIADHLGLPGQKNAVLGKADRLKLPKRRKAYAQVSSSEKLEAMRKREALKKETARLAKEERQRLKAEKAKSPAAAPAAEPFGTSDNRTLSSPVWQAGDRPLMPLVDLTDRTCRFPLGDPLQPGFGFCGDHTQAKLNKRGDQIGLHRYCATHQKIVTIPREIRK